MTQFPRRQKSPTESRLRLRELLAAGSLEMPGAYDAPSAQVVARLGFQALWGGGYVGSVTRLGVGDINLMTMVEQAAFVSSLVDATGLPVVADADDGYGEGLQISRAVQLFERAGVAALVIEDQGSPKHCAFYEKMPLKLITPKAHVAKIKAAVDARTDESMMIWGRTDALPATGNTTEAFERASAAVEAGAEAVFIPSASLEHLAEIGSQWKHPQPLVMSGFNFLDMHLDQVKEIGFAARLHPLPAILAALGAVENLFRQLADTGSLGKAAASSMLSSDFEKLIGNPLAEGIDERFRSLADS